MFSQKFHDFVTYPLFGDIKAYYDWLIILGTFIRWKVSLCCGRVTTHAKQRESRCLQKIFSLGWPLWFEPLWKELFRWGWRSGQQSSQDSRRTYRYWWRHLSPGQQNHRSSLRLVWWGTARILCEPGRMERSIQQLHYDRWSWLQMLPDRWIAHASTHALAILDPHSRGFWKLVFK